MTATPYTYRPRRLARLVRNPSGLIATIIVTLFLVMTVAGPWIAPYDPNELGSGTPLQGPSAEHWFGTDELGRDQLSRVVSAARVAVGVSVISVTIALVVGGIGGIAAGYARGLTDKILVRVMDVMFSFPTLLLAIVIVAVLGPGLLTASLAIAIVYTPRFARVARGAALGIRNELYIEAAQLAGVHPVRIARRHVVPNIAAPMTVLAALSMSTAQLAYAALSFLGLGTLPPQADYGSMLARARNFMTIAPSMVIFPSIALVLLIVGFNLFGDALRDVLDPRAQRGKASIQGVEATI
ncbi:MAG TPA: ABC transporter permease [Acidimicrobiia bacterium]|nr:ABC transporter permease [Acidimicrobiia bacterium]